MILRKKKEKAAWNAEFRRKTGKTPGLVACDVIESIVLLVLVNSFARAFGVCLSCPKGNKQQGGMEHGNERTHL